MTSLVLHAFGEARGGAPWAAAFDAAGISVVAPDLPGHGATGPFPGRCYQLDDPAVVAAQWFADTASERVDLVVGVGASGLAAHILAMAGRAERLVLVDGLGGPFVEVGDLMVQRQERLRRVVELDDSWEPGDGVDPRAEFVASGHHDRRFAMRLAAAVEVPTLIIETDASSTAVSEAAELAPSYPAEIVRVETVHPGEIAAAVRAWWPSN